MDTAALIFKRLREIDDRLDEIELRRLRLEESGLVDDSPGSTYIRTFDEEERLTKEKYTLLEKLKSL